MEESSPEYCPASTSSSEGSSESSSKTETCQVCGQKAHGSHFGAITCRACAAFFRRVAAGANFVIRCRNGNGKCEVVSNGRSCCKKCRLKRCKDIGMDIKNFQFDRDLISTSKHITPSLAMFVGRPQFIILCDPEAAASTSTATFIDLSDLLKKAMKLLTAENKIPRAPGQNRLRKLSTALNFDRYVNSEEGDFQEITSIGLKETLSFWEHDVLTVSKWLTYFDEFQDLNQDSKLKFVRAIWYAWNRCEKLGRLAMYLKNQRAERWDKSSLFVTDDYKLDLKKMKLDIGWLTNYSVEQIAYYIEGVGDWSMFSPLQPLIDLNPTDVELNYMLAQISFSYAAKELPQELSETAERFLKLLADDLHNYYARELNVKKYSDRVLKMMKVNNMIMRVIFDRKEKIAIARTFDIFNVKFSEPDMFKDIY